MRVSFVNPPITPYRKIMRNFDCATESKGNYLYQPYDFLLLSSKVPADWPLQFIDAIASQYDDKEIFSRLEAYRPEVIVCALAATNWQQDLVFVKKLRQSFPDSYLLVFGDLFIEKKPSETISPYVDGILTSPVTFDLKKLENISREDFQATEHEGFRTDAFYSRSDLKSPTQIYLKGVRHRDFLHQAYRWPFSRYFQYTTIFTAWGCPYSCSYCILNKFPNYWRDYREILDEMEDVRRLGIREIYIGDRSFGLPLPNVIKLLEGMIERKFHFSWSTYFHPNQYTPELLEKMKRAGCHTIIVGVETADQGSLKAYGRHVRQHQFQSLIQHAKALEIEICGDFIIGLPHDTRQSVEETISYACTMGIDFASFNVAAPLAGSSIRSQAITDGKLKEGEEHFDSLGNQRVLSVSSLTPDEIIGLRNKAVFRFYARPYYLIDRLKSIKTPQHLLIQLQEAWQLFRKVL